MEDYRALAKRRLPRAVFDFIDGGAGQELTLRWNEEAFQRYVFHPRVLADMSGLDVTTTVLGSPVSLPVLLGPCGAQRLVSREGETAPARAAAKQGTIYCLNVGSSRTMEEVAESAPDGRRWFQLYLWHGHAWAEALLRRAQDADYEALVVTVDIKAPAGRRYRDIRNGIARLPESLRPGTVLDAARRPRWVSWYFLGGPIRMVHMEEAGGRGASMLQATNATYRRMDPAATWDEVRWLRRLWAGPLVVKGILTSEDAGTAFDCGVDAVICSNHGGRALDGAPASLDVLPRISEVADSRGKEVYLDGGVRSGGDVLKALSLGATACLVVRPFLWGLTVGGQAGVEAVLESFRQEMRATMTSLGLSSVSKIDGLAIEDRRR